MTVEKNYFDMTTVPVNIMHNQLKHSHHKNTLCSKLLGNIYIDTIKQCMRKKLNKNALLFFEFSK